jgi:hypothetical protein
LYNYITIQGAKNIQIYVNVGPLTPFLLKSWPTLFWNYHDEHKSFQNGSSLNMLVSVPFSKPRGAAYVRNTPYVEQLIVVRTGGQEHSK